MLTERQQTAAAIAAELVSAWVVSPLPLDGNAKLRFQVLDSNRYQVIESPLPRICLDGMKPAR